MVNDNQTLLILFESIENTETPFYFKLTGSSCLNNPGPPTFGLTKVGVVMCNVGKRINVDTIDVATLTILGHTRPCVPKDIRSDT